MAKGAVIARIISEYSDKGTKAAVKDLEKTGEKFKDFGNKVGKAFAVAAAASAAFAIKLGVDAVKAAMEEQQQMALLANTLRNTTGANEEAISSVERYIKATELRLGVQDTQLIPSLRSLLVATQNVSKAEALQGLALDISASKGKDLGEVSVALAKAYLGNFNALKRMGVPISENIIKTKDFSGAVKSLTAAFGGSAKIAADTFEGRITRIGLAFEEVKKTIGNAIIVALQPFLDKFIDALPKIEKWLNDNAKKIAGFFITGITYGVAFAQTVYDIFNFVSRNIRVFAELGAVIVAAWAGAKVAAAAGFIVTTIKDLIKVYKTLTTVAKGAAFWEAISTGGLSAAAGAAAAATAFVAINVAFDKFMKNAEKSGKGVGDLKFNFKGLSTSAADYLKGLKGIDNQNNSTTTSTKNLTKAQIDALAALKKLGVVPTTSTDPIELEAARLNLIKQGNLEEARRTQALLDQLDAQMKNNQAAQRYADILQVLADNQISSQEVAVLAQKWNITSGQVMEYIARIYAANSTPANSEAVIQLYMAWGLTREQAQKYLDFAVALKDQKLDDTEIQNLMTKWNMTRAEVIAYAKKVQDGTVFSSTWADPGNAAKKAWEDALAALNAYLAKVNGNKVAATSETLPTGVVIEPSKGGSAATAALTQIGLSESLSAVNTAVAAAQNTAASANEIANVMAQTLISSPEMTAQLGGVAGALSSARYTGQALAWAAANGMLGSTTSAQGNTTIIVQGNVQTQSDNVAAIRQDLLNSQLSGKQITALAVAL